MKRREAIQLAWELYKGALGRWNQLSPPEELKILPTFRTWYGNYPLREAWLGVAMQAVNEAHKHNFKPLAPP